VDYVQLWGGSKSSLAGNCAFSKWQHWPLTQPALSCCLPLCLLLLLLQVLFGCVWDVTLLHSHPSMAMWLGSGAIAAGVFGTTATTRSGSSSNEAAATAAAAASEGQK
jgi:drug/metabolite transporter (DMT)-like permease